MKPRSLVSLPLLWLLCGVTLTAQIATVEAFSPAPLAALNTSWRFHAGDDPRFADPVVDDSAWPLLRPGQSFASANLPNPDSGYFWARLHLHAANPEPALAIRLLTNNGIVFEIYANGNRI